ncbi:MAG: glycosyltransferase family 2 protein [Acidobacteria bacterium]|nr:MAG: glycosyltransferase family 2 protein [Acidobacteriota bacterium]
MAPGLSIVIPTWNGLELLRECLPSVLKAAARYRHSTRASTEIIVVDDGSRDETLSRLPAEFPEVCLVVRPVNGGFAVACNDGFARCRYPLIGLLNNDVWIDENYFIHQAAHFDDPDVFAVTARVFGWDEPVFMTGGRYGRFRRGFWSVYFNYDVHPDKAREWIEQRRLLSAYAIGGFSTYRRDRLIELGGFNALLSPFHWEDVDLAYRGWRRGWDVRYEPRSVAYHKVSATIDRNFKKRHVDAVSFRNRLLFHWVNLHSPTFLVRHILMLAVMFMTRVLVLDFDFYRALFQALTRLGEVRQLRRQEKAKAVRSDADVARLLKRFYREAPIRVFWERGPQISPEEEPLSVRPHAERTGRT